MRFLAAVYLLGAFIVLNRPSITAEATPMIAKIHRCVLMLAKIEQPAPIKAARINMREFFIPPSYRAEAGL